MWPGILLCPCLCILIVQGKTASPPPVVGQGEVTLIKEWTTLTLFPSLGVTASSNEATMACNFSGTQISVWGNMGNMGGDGYTIIYTLDGISESLPSNNIFNFALLYNSNSELGPGNHSLQITFSSYQLHIGSWYAINQFIVTPQTGDLPNFPSTTSPPPTTPSIPATKPTTTLMPTSQTTSPATKYFVIGIVLGFLALLVVLILFGLWWRHRRRKSVKAGWAYKHWKPGMSKASIISSEGVVTFTTPTVSSLFTPIGKFYSRYSRHPSREGGITPSIVSREQYMLPPVDEENGGDRLSSRLSIAKTDEIPENHPK